MRRRINALAAMAALAIVVSCAGGAPRGGAAEVQLTAATQAMDLARVKPLLASGADPNKLVPVAGNPQSAWYLALQQLRPSKPATADIIIAMRGAGANPASAWGTSGGRPREGFWEAFFSGDRIGSTPFGAAIATRNAALMVYLEDHGGMENGR